MKQWESESNAGKDIIQSIAANAAGYTPEWNFNQENPDIGSALAYVYADMMEDTVKQLERLEYKNRLAFFNCLGAKQNSASCARGFAVLCLVQDAPGGTEVEMHTGMKAEMPAEDGGTVRFETEEDLYVTPAQPLCMYLTDGQQDAIYKIADDMQNRKESVTLFRRKGENLQCHEIYLAHDEILNIKGEAHIGIDLYSCGNQPVQEKILQSLADPFIADFSYWTGENWQNFSQVTATRNGLLLEKDASLPAFEKIKTEEPETYMIRCRVKDIAGIGQISVEKILLQSRGKGILPQYIYGADTECGQKEFFPFGERMNLYEEVYIGSDEVFTKCGAVISLKFRLDYIQIPLEGAIEQAPIEWKWIMKRSEFNSDPEYDITVEDVIWEYYNGTGWSRLFPDNEYADIFRPRQDAYNHQKTIRFICPQDITPILVNSCETCYIRARITKMKNLYKPKGKYISPVIINPMLSYDYGEIQKTPRMLKTENNMEQKTYSEGELSNNDQAIRLFTGLPEKEKSLYIGFGMPPVGSPIRMLWVMEDILIGQRGNIQWEYENSRGFWEMNIADLTGHLARSGTVTFVGPEDFCKTSRFEKDMYWIRLRDISGYYSEDNKKVIYPVLQGLWMNAVKIRHTEREETERFTLNYYKEDCCFKLLHGNIDTIAVEVLEGNEEEERWTVWEEVPDIELQPEGSKVYQIDRIEGLLRFGNGMHGSVPPLGIPDGIRIRYRCGGGSKGNVEQGKVNKLNRTVGFVSGVSNPMAMWGGLDAETPAESIRRYSARLHHGNRALTVRDYEKLAMEASRVLQKVRCFGGKNAKGEKEAGAVTLVIYPKDGYDDKEFLHAVQKDICNHLAPRMDQGILTRGQLYITEPKMAEIHVRAEVTVEDFQDIFQVRHSAQQKIRNFLDPVKGHFDGGGWEIGQFPDALQLQNVLKEIPKTTWISKIYLMTYVTGNKGRQEVDPEYIRRHPYVLPNCEKVEVVVTVKGR